MRVGMAWGGIGGVLGFLASLLGSPVGLVVGVFVGYLCGRRSAAEDAGRPGALSGLIGGAVAVPVYAVGASAGALVAARIVGSSRFAGAFQDMTGMEISPDEAWVFFVLGVFVITILQAMLFVAAATVAGALAKRGQNG